MKKRNKQSIRKGSSKTYKEINLQEANIELKKAKSQNNFLSVIKKNIWIILILTLTILIYLNSIKNGFVFWDDDTYLHNNPFIKSLDINNLKRIFTESYFCNYHPLTTLTYAIEYSLFKLNPQPYHLLNLLLHLINTFLVFLLIKGITKRNELSLITALLFAIHPMHVESIAWISETKDVLYAVFYLLSLIFYVKYQKKREDIKYLVIALIMFIFSMMSKSAAVTLPLIMLLFSYSINKKIIKKDWLYTIPFFALSLVFGIIAIKAQKNAIGTEEIRKVYMFYEKSIIVCFAICFYIVRFIAPLKFSALHPYPDIVGSTLPMEYYFAPVLIIFLIIIIFISKKELRSALIFGLLFFIITISLVIQIIPLGDAIVSERYTYIPYIGLSYILAYLFLMVTGKNNKVVMLSLTVPYLLFLSYSTIKQNATWKDSEILWNKALEIYPKNYIAYNYRGNYRLEQNNAKGAIEDYSKAIALNPKYSIAYYDQGIAKDKLGDINGAIEDYSKAISFNPRYADAYNNRGQVKTKLGDISGAIEDYNKALSISPQYNTYNNRGIAKCNLGNIKEAIEDYNNAILLIPYNTAAYISRGNAYKDLKDFDAALKDFNKAIEIDSRSSEAYNSRGSAWELRGKLDKALADYNIAIQINPEYAFAYCNRGIVNAKLGNNERAVQDFNKAILIKPDYTDAYTNRGLVKVKNNDIDGAINDYCKAISINSKYANAYNNRGEALAIKGKLYEAYTDFNEAILIDSNFVDAYSNRGNIMRLTGRSGEALIEYKKAIQINPNYYKAYENIASLYYNKGEYKQALPYFEKVTEIDPEYAHGYYNLANTKFNLHDIKGACTDWNNALKRGDESAQPLFQKYCH